MLSDATLQLLGGAAVAVVVAAAAAAALNAVLAAAERVSWPSLAAAAAPQMAPPPPPLQRSSSGPPQRLPAPWSVAGALLPVVHFGVLFAALAAFLFGAGAVTLPRRDRTLPVWLSRVPLLGALLQRGQRQRRV